MRQNFKFPFLKPPTSMIRTFTIFALCLHCSTACSAEPAQHTPPPPSSYATDPSPQPQTLIKEQWVLDGTDLLPLTSITLSANAANAEWPGHYASEQGGSQIAVKITQDKKSNELLLTRTYREPGRAVTTKQYSLNRSKEKLMGENNHVLVQKTSEGIIVLETQSGLDSIPSDYWIHYLKNN